MKTRMSWTALAIAALSMMPSAAPIARAANFGPNAGSPAALRLHFQSDVDQPSGPLRLRGSDARQQILVTAELADGTLRDFTRQVHLQATPTGIVEISPSGLVSPLSDGHATITATTEEGSSASLEIVVEQSRTTLPINFPNQIVPIFTKAGCNGGGCHGKSGGQNGFRLSLLGFEPAEDFEHLVKESRGRRLFPAAPDHSLLLLKATGILPHGGGKRLDVDSDDYRLLLRWIRQGMPYGNPGDPVVDHIQVVPCQRTMGFDNQQQLVVIAHYTDGSIEDVTRSALYEANDKEVAGADGGGLVKVFRQPGDAAVMVRYQAKVAVFRATVPLGAVVEKLPDSRNFIDELVFKKLKTIGMPPSGACDDATFLRRVTIDIAGRLPTADEARRFLDDTDPAKRDKWIASLLDSPQYADYFANKWSALLRNKRTAPVQIRGTFEFHDWIRQSLASNKPYDQFVRQVIAASGDIESNPPVAWYRQVKDSTAMVEDVAQLFLGTRMNCAKCHHHPFEKWSQQDYYSLAAFFSTVVRRPNPVDGDEVIFARRGAASAVNPKTRKSVEPAGLGATPPELSPDDDPRQALADWMTRKDNPLFARTLVNRYWKHFFGRGIVEPEDDLRETNPPTNPELLDALAKHFADSGFDLKDLIRTITRSQTYQLSAIPNSYNAVDKQYFSRFYPRRLTAEVLLDAIDQVTRSPSAFNGLPPGTRAVELPDNSYNEASFFLTVFGRPDSSSACECERSQDASLAQSLHLFNSRDVQDKLTSDKGLPAHFAADTHEDAGQKLADLYFAALGRAPDASELQLANGYIQKMLTGNSGKEDPKLTRRHAYEDIVWALLNTKEFLFNH